MRNKYLVIGTATLLLGLGAAGAAKSIDPPPENNGPIRCEIHTEMANGMMTVQSDVHADFDTQGTYRFTLTSVSHAGSTNLSQGGNFSAGPEKSATLGKMILGGNGTQYDASLEISANGETITCNERLGPTV